MQILLRKKGNMPSHKNIMPVLSDYLQWQKDNSLQYCLWKLYAIVPLFGYLLLMPYPVLNLFQWIWNISGYIPCHPLILIMVHWINFHTEVIDFCHVVIIISGAPITNIS